MSHQLTDFLSRETAEYLDQLERVLAIPGAPDPEHVLRLARGARGSAEMAGFDGVRRVAEALEQAAGVRAASQGGWSGASREAALDTVRDLQLLVRGVGAWGEGEEEIARRALERWTGRPDGSAEEETDVVPIDALFFDDEGPHVLSGPTPADAIVPIEELLLRGDAALREALRLRPELDRLLDRSAPAAARELIAELFDLIELALPGEKSPGG
jgi:HPt (histidine-containing phosphotransfer) domain-containing protein